MIDPDTLRRNAASLGELDDPPPGIIGSLELAAAEIERLGTALQSVKDIAHNPANDSIAIVEVYVAAANALPSVCEGKPDG